MDSTIWASQALSKTKDVQRRQVRMVKFIVSCSLQFDDWMTRVMKIRWQLSVKASRVT